MGREVCGPEGERAWGRGSTSGAHAKRARVEGWGEGKRGKRTINMRLMSVTLSVLKVTGWLKASAACRAERWGV